MTHSIVGEVPADDFEIGAASPERSRAASEVGAAIAHQLSGPLTALLLYVGDLSENSDRLSDADGEGQSLQRVALNALREAERICILVSRIGDACEAPLPKEAGIAHAREVISWWSGRGNSNGGGVSGPAGYAIQKRLTPRERQVLNLIREGCSNKEGGSRLQISYRTFESHRAEIMRKFGARNAADLIRLSSLALETSEVTRPVASVQT